MEFEGAQKTSHWFRPSSNHSGLHLSTASSSTCSGTDPAHAHQNPSAGRSKVSVGCGSNQGIHFQSPLAR